MSPAIHGVVDHRVLVNYRVDPEDLDTALPGPFRGREVGESGKGIGTVCLTKIENARPKFAPESVGVSVRSVTHRIYAEMETARGNRFCAYAPVRGVSSRFCAVVGRRALPAELDCAEFSVGERGDTQQMRVDCGGEYASVEFRETDREEVDEDSVFYSVESASVFLCEGGVEYSPLGDGYRYGGVEFCPSERELEPVDVADARSSYFETLGGAFDSAFRMEGIEHEWQPRRSVGKRR